MAFTQPEFTTSPLVETSAQIQRTLVVSVGGTGAEIIKRLKRRLQRQGQASTFIRFLSLDTDVRTWLASPQFPPLEQRERARLDYASPEHVLEAPHLYPTLQHLFHQGKRFDISLLANGSGAGLMPVVGRVGFHLNAAQIHAQLDRALRDLQAIPAQPGGQPLTEEFRIYIIGSVAGGTGAGCFLETSVLARHVFRTFKKQVIGVLALPEAFAPALRGQQLDSQSRGNAYAVLKEIQYLQDGPVHWNDPETFTCRFHLGADVTTVTLNQRPFDILYVVDNQNQEGGALRNLTDIYEMVAQHLAVEIGSPFGAKFASAQANDRAIKGLAPCPETGRPANWSSLATAALVIPEEKLLRYLSRRFLNQVLRERLLGPIPGGGEAVQGWLLAAGLEERGGQRMISRALLTDPREGAEVTGGQYAIEPEEQVGKPVAEFLAAFAGQEEYFESQVLPTVKHLVDRNLERLRAEAAERIASMLEEAIAAGGVRGALGRRAAVDRELEAMAADLAHQQSADEANHEEMAARIRELRDELEGRSGLLGGLFGKRKELMRLLGRLQADLMQVELDMMARAVALRLVEAVRASLEEHRRRLGSLESNLTRLCATVEAELAQGSYGGDAGSAYALETEVILADHYGAYYERFRPASTEPFLAGLGAERRLSGLTGLDYGRLAQLLCQGARDLFQQQVQQLNVVDVLNELYTRTTAFNMLDDLARRCQPFWTATPRGAGAFSDVFLIGSPGVQNGNPANPVQAEPLLQEWVNQHAGGTAGLRSAPTYVALGSPGAIIFSRQTHGARLHYLRQILDYQEHYRALQQQRGYPVHFKPCLEALPELRPDDEKATEWWALGVAYGMVAVKTFGWVWALESEQRKDPENPGGLKRVERLMTGSLWDMAAEIAPVEPREVAPHSSRFLHATRSGALGQFQQRREFMAAVERLVGRRLDAAGKQAVGAELARYLDDVLAPRVKRVEEMEAATLAKEEMAIRRFLDRLNLM